MNIDLAALQVLLLALPGFVWLRFVRFIKGSTREDNGNEIISGLVFGTLTYITLYPIFLICGADFHMAAFGTDLWKFSDSIDEVLLSLPLAIGLSSIFLFLRRRNFPLNLFRRIGVTNYSGDTDIWDYCFSEFRGNGSFVNVRDHSEGLVYQGFTKGFSERGDLRELLLTDVEVFDSAGECLYKTSAVYLGKAPDKVSIDFYDEEGVMNGQNTKNFWHEIKLWWARFSGRWKTGNDHKG